MNYWRNLAVAVSQALSTLFGGHPDMTISARVYLAARRGGERAQRWERRLNWLFAWLEEDHCRESFEADVRHASQVFRWQREILSAQQKELMK